MRRSRSWASPTSAGSISTLSSLTRAYGATPGWPAASDRPAVRPDDRRGGRGTRVTRGGRGARGARGGSGTIGIAAAVQRHRIVREHGRGRDAGSPAAGVRGEAAEQRPRVAGGEPLQGAAQGGGPGSAEAAPPAVLVPPASSWYARWARVPAAERRMTR